MIRLKAQKGTILKLFQTTTQILSEYTANLFVKYMKRLRERNLYLRLSYFISNLLINVHVHDLIKCLKQVKKQRLLLTNAPISELPSSTSTMISRCLRRLLDWPVDRGGDADRRSRLRLTSPGISEYEKYSPYWWNWFRMDKIGSLCMKLVPCGLNWYLMNEIGSLWMKLIPFL